MFDNIPAVLPQVQGKLIKAIAVAGAKRANRSLTYPRLRNPVPGFEASAWFGLVAPAKTPAPVLAKLGKRSRRDPENVRCAKALHELGAEPARISGAAFGRFLADETAKWTKSSSRPARRSLNPAALLNAQIAR